ncbi:hypothetical protein ASG37_15800 [Sphingomonas sp. Leaf407]|nr:hypothetical protein ASE97_15055 [Sphingomonas sp. Leaf42]KQT25336.1 hypothetical protein ASG37_15800 [Sphingomonas sp. Leaf407]
MARVLAAALAGEDGSVERLFLVYDRSDCPTDAPAPAGTEIFGDRDDFDACILQLARHLEEQPSAAGHAAQHEHEYRIDRMIVGDGLSHHAAELGATIILAAEAGVGKFLNDGDAVLARIIVDGTALRLNALRRTILLVDGKAQIGIGADGVGTGHRLPLSDQVAKLVLKGIEHGAEFGRCDRRRDQAVDDQPPTAARPAIDTAAGLRMLIEGLWGHPVEMTGWPRTRRNLAPLKQRLLQK